MVAVGGQALINSIMCFNISSRLHVFSILSYKSMLYYIKHRTGNDTKLSSLPCLQILSRADAAADASTQANAPIVPAALPPPSASPSAKAPSAKASSRKTASGKAKQAKRQPKRPIIPGERSSRRRRNDFNAEKLSAKKKVGDFTHMTRDLEL